MDRKTVALGVAAAVAVVVAVTVTLVDRSSASPRHRVVAGYIKAVDQIQQQMQAQLTDTVSAYHLFASGSVPAKTLAPQLARAELTLRRLERRIAALPAPAIANHLRVLLIRLTGAEVSTAHEVGQLAIFSPRYAVISGASRLPASSSRARLRP
jgi:hypothetical protein